MRLIAVPLCLTSIGLASLTGCAKKTSPTDDNPTSDLISWIHNDQRDGDPEPKDVIEVLLKRLSIATVRDPKDYNSWKYLGDTYIAIETFRPDAHSPYLGMSEAAYLQALELAATPQQRSESWWQLAEINMRRGVYEQAELYTKNSFAQLRRVDAAMELQKLKKRITNAKLQGFMGVDRYGRPRR